MAKIKVKQTGSPIRRTQDQRATLIGLVRGMIRKVQHMVEVQD